MFVRAICFESTRPSSEHALAIWGVPELAVFAMFAFAVTVLVARWLAVFSIWGPTRGAGIIFGFTLGLALAFALALVSAISIAVQRVARGGAGAAGAAPS
jgi:hypothetical protein